MQQSAFDYIRHGQTPFFRLPIADGQERESLYKKASAVLLGVPYDGGTTHQPGARFAPYHVRRVSALVQGYHPGHRVDVFRALPTVDGGNIAVPPFSPPSVRELIQHEVSRVLQAEAIPFVLGGDHSIALPILRAVAAAHGPVAVLHIDAHLDTSPPETWGESFHHGTPFRHAISENLIARDHLYQVGIRATWGGPDEDAPSRAHGARIFTALDVARLGIEAVAREVLGSLGNRPLYISLDIDGIDPSFAPGTGTPVPGGLTSREAISLLHGLLGCRIVGMDLVEVCPALDVADMTSLLAAHLLYEGLALAAMGR